MIELAQHIEALLLENDCVILPEFGGFITHHTAASWNEQEELFMPPVRTLGFNPQLKLNDGLLVQSYMATYDTNFPDANQKVKLAVEKLSNQLYTNGKVELTNVGEIRYTIRRTYEFTPFDDKAVAPALYGLDSFELKKVSALRKPMHTTAAAVAVRSSKTPVRKKKARKEHRINYAYLYNTAAMIAIIALFFGISTPIENTYIEKNNYAQLMPSDLFEKIGSQSVVFTPIITPQAPRKTPDGKPITVKEVLVPKATATTSGEAIAANSTPAAKEISAPKEPVDTPKESATPKVEAPAKEQPQSHTATTQATAPKASPEANQPQANNKKYHIIVAGGVMQKNAETLATQLKNKGYIHACVLNCNGIIRVSLMAYATDTEATQQLLKVREKEEFKNAWMLANK